MESLSVEGFKEQKVLEIFYHVTRPVFGDKGRRQYDKAPFQGGLSSYLPKLCSIDFCYHIWYHLHSFVSLWLVERSLFALQIGLNPQSKGNMFSSLKSFFSTLRSKLRMVKIEWEIYHRIFCHLEAEKDCQYEFKKQEELEKLIAYAELDADFLLSQIRVNAYRMPKSYGLAFQYIMYRDLNSRLKIYTEFIKSRTYRANPDPRTVAIRA